MTRFTLYQPHRSHTWVLGFSMTLGEGQNYPVHDNGAGDNTLNNGIQEGKPIMSFQSLQPPQLLSALRIKSRPRTMLYKALQSLHLAQHSSPGVPKLGDLMPNDLRWKRCTNNRTKVHSKCNALESPQNHPPILVCGNTVFHKIGPWCQKGWGLLL